MNGMDDYQQFIFYRTYSRWLPEKRRRESWEEAITRYLDYVFSKVPNADKIPEKVRRKATEYMMSLQVMPSMRALWTAGPAADRDNCSFYNCSALGIDSLEAFGEVLYLLSCGCGVGYSVEQRYIEKLPVVKKQKEFGNPIEFKISDSREGWKEAIDIGMAQWFSGRDVKYDYSDIRPAGATLKTFGGKASGPFPLFNCLTFIRRTILGAQERQLTSLEISDILNEIASAIVSGGVRRSSQIALTDFDDNLMRTSKHGDLSKENNERRAMANISAVYHSKPDVLTFAQEFIDMAKSESGERGLFNLYAAKKRAPKRRLKSLLAVCNPCAEIVLRAMGFCNLTEVIVRAWDDEDSVRDKITTAVWLGLIQSCFTYFPQLRPQWKQNCEEERLLGVSLSGLCDNISLISPEVLRMWKRHAVRTAKKAAEIMEVAMPAAVTTIKPSGTVSQLCNCASGMHSRWSEYYIRRVRINMHDPLFKMMVDQGFKYKPAPENNATVVFEFPIKSPSGSKLRSEDAAIVQLNWYKMLVENWAEHNVSSTIFVKDNEWLDVTKYVYDNFEIINGVSFYPFDGTKHELPPYEEIDEETYNKMLEELPTVDFSQLYLYEEDDNTEGAKTYACTGSNCELS